MNILTQLINNFDSIHLQTSIIGFHTEIFLLINLLLLLITGTLLESNKKIVLIIPIAWMLCWVFFLAVLIYTQKTSDYSLLFSGFILISPSFTFMKIIVLILSIFIIIASLKYLKLEFFNNFEYIIIKGFAIYSLILILNTNDFMPFYILIEIQSICMYILCGINKRSSYSIEAAIKYFLLGGLASSLLVFGLSLLYSFTGTLNFTHLHLFFINSPSCGISNTINSGIFGLIFITTGIFFKLSSAPFHSWAPDVYEGTPISLTAFLAILPKFVIVVFSIKVYFYSFMFLNDIWQTILLLSGILSLCIGTYGALMQRKFKRFLAYSSIVQIGTMLLALSTYSSIGLQGTLLYLYIYITISLGIFSILLTSKEFRSFIINIVFLKETNILLSYYFIILLFSLAGIPPLAGFWSKIFIYYALISNNYFFTAIIASFLGIVGAFYYVRIIKILLIENKKILLDFSISKEISFLVPLMTFISLGFILYPHPFLLYFERASFLF
jgi:NADH-quinone oxidoreductase subunit N